MIVGSPLTINTVGQVVDDSGEPGRPIIQVTLQQQGNAMGLLSAEMFDDQGFDAPLVMGADGGGGDLSEYSLEGDQMQATVSGTVQRLTGYSTGEPRLVDGAEHIPATISWSVTLPPLD